MGEIPVIKPEVYQRIYCKNCDIEVDSAWLRDLYEGMERHPECGMATSRMMFFHDR